MGSSQSQATDISSSVEHMQHAPKTLLQSGRKQFSRATSLKDLNAKVPVQLGVPTEQVSPPMEKQHQKLDRMGVTFKPGPVGMRFHDDSGVILEVIKDSQAEHHGLKVGMLIKKIGTESFSQETLIKHAHGNKDYEVYLVWFPGKLQDKPLRRSVENYSVKPRFERKQVQSASDHFRTDPGLIAAPAVPAEPSAPAVHPSSQMSAMGDEVLARVSSYPMRNLSQPLRDNEGYM